MRVALNFRVVASVDESYSFETDAAKKQLVFAKRAKELEAEIRRHCDGFAQTWIEYDSECSHCGLSWETEKTGEPVCCTKAQEEWERNRSTAALELSTKGE
jgi:hypothetical protein